MVCTRIKDVVRCLGFGGREREHGVRWSMLATNLGNGLSNCKAGAAVCRGRKWASVVRVVWRRFDYEGQ